MGKGLTFQIEKTVLAKVQRNKTAYDQRAIGNCHGWKLKTLEKYTARRGSKEKKKIIKL